jgi:hypothetical protein
MRRVAVGVVAVLVGVGVAVAMAASRPVLGADGPAATITASGAEHPPLVPAVVLGSGPIWGYWGKVTGDDTGSYRATCVLLGAPSPSVHPHMPAYAGKVRAADDTDETRLSCQIVFSFGGSEDPHGTLIAVGLVPKPSANKGLFDMKYNRPLAVTGGSGGSYFGKQGSATIGDHGKIVFAYQ